MPYRRIHEFVNIYGARTRLEDGPAVAEFIRANYHMIREHTVHQDWYPDNPRWWNGRRPDAPDHADGRQPFYQPHVEAAYQLAEGFRYNYADIPEPNPIAIRDVAWAGPNPDPVAIEDAGRAGEHFRAAYAPYMQYERWYAAGGNIGGDIPYNNTRSSVWGNAESQQRSRELLERHLTDEQTEQYTRDGTFVVAGSMSPQRQYLISTKAQNPSHNVWRLNTETGKKIRSYCLHLAFQAPGNGMHGQFPLYDHFLAQAVMLATDEARFLSTAYSGHVGVETEPAAGLEMHPAENFVPPRRLPFMNINMA